MVAYWSVAVICLYLFGYLYSCFSFFFFFGTSFNVYTPGRLARGFTYANQDPIK